MGACPQKVRRLAERGRKACHGGHTLHKKTVQGGERCGRQRPERGRAHGTTPEDILSRNPDVREVDKGDLREGPSQEQARGGARLCLQSSSTAVALCE